MGIDITAETWGTGLSSGDGETFVPGFGGVRGIIELTQLQAEKGVCYRASFAQMQRDFRRDQTRGLRTAPLWSRWKRSIESSSGCMMRRPLSESGRRGQWDGAVGQMPLDSEAL